MTLGSMGAKRLEKDRNVGNLDAIAQRCSGEKKEAAGQEETGRES